MYEFTPMQIKQATVGYATRRKSRCRKWSASSPPEKYPRPDDAADALAVAICCAGAWGRMINEQYGIK